MDGMSGSSRWCTIVDDPIEEAVVVLVGGETHVYNNLSGYIVPVRRQLTQTVHGFVEEP